MSVFRSYFSKNNTLIEGNKTNNSQNPVTEISFGTVNADISRFIFDVNFQPLLDRIEQGIIPANSIQRHILRMTNTIRYRPDLVGGRFADGIQQRSGSFSLELFNVNEDWDEGNGYEFVYHAEEQPQIPEQVSNWYDRKTATPWTVEGAFISGTSEIVGIQQFEKGNEDIYIDITDYVNSRLFSGETGFTTTSFGLGLKFPTEIEILETSNRQAVAFHAKNTNTFYEPFIETIYDVSIKDDRNCFFLDKENELYLYSNIGGKLSDIIVNSVTILDYEDNEILTLSGESIQRVKAGVYKISIQIDSDVYPDAVLFTDRWNITVNGKTKNIDQEFYLISSDNYYNFSNTTPYSMDNYYFTYRGISEGEKIKRSNDLRKIFIDIKEFYPNQNNSIPFDVEYRLYVTQSDKFEIDVISWTKADRTSNSYEFELDTSWLIPQDYFLALRLDNGNVIEQKKPLRFTVVSDGVTSSN